MYIGCSSSYANCVGLRAMNSKYSMQIPSGIPPAMHSKAFIAEFESSLNKSCCFPQQKYIEFQQILLVSAKIPNKVHTKC